jgi:hypothetical protein
LSLYSFTSIAWVGHCATHAMQRMQSCSLTGTALLLLSSKTLTGQIEMQIASPLHFSGSTFTDTISINLT